MTGPDLTGAGGRYTPRDLLDNIINPSKEINEQFVPTVITKTERHAGDRHDREPQQRHRERERPTAATRTSRSPSIAKSDQHRTVESLPQCRRGLLNILTRDEVPTSSPTS